VSPTASPSGAASASPVASASASPSSSASSSPDANLKIGAWVNPTGSTGSSSQKIAALETQIGHTFDISLHYDAWTANFPSSDESTDRAVGRIPEVGWKCGVSDATVASGGADAVIAPRAAQMAAYGHPIFLRFDWEFNLPYAMANRTICADASDTGGYFDPTNFIAAWRHIHDLFVAAGATNVAFVWNPTVGGTDATPYWPGDAYVDWVGIDAFDTSGKGIVTTLNVPYAKYATMGNGLHPVMVGETGGLQSNQPTYLDAASRTILAQNFPLVRAISYFDAPGPAEDWSLTPTGITSFAAFVNSR
jgi:endoglucanase